MRVFVAGASGAIGQPLIWELIRQRHAVTGMTHSEPGAQKLVAMGTAVAMVDAFEEPLSKGLCAGRKPRSLLIN